MSNSGAVKTFNAEKGFGFIIGADGADIFLHIKQCVDGGIPKVGDTVTFELEESKMKPGQMQASSVSGGTGTAADKGAGKGKGQPGTGQHFGQCKSFVQDKGFGFIVGPDGADVFLHIAHMADGSTPEKGDNLQFDMEPSKSKPEQMTANNVTGGTGWPRDTKGKGKDGGKGGYGAWGGGKDAWGGKGGPYGGGKDAWGGKGGGYDSWGGDGGWGGGKDAWGGKGGGKDMWGGKGGGWGGKGGW
jgi:cold shock CspA family protein